VQTTRFAERCGIKSDFYLELECLAAAIVVRIWLTGSLTGATAMGGRSFLLFDLRNPENHIGKIKRIHDQNLSSHSE